jgi:cysteine dioxygenase
MPNSLAGNLNSKTTENHWDWASITAALEPRFEHARTILTQAGVNETSLRALSVPPVSDPYGRKVLFRSEKFEVMLATWASGAECAPHDHGDARGIVWLVEGDFTETHYELTENLTVIGKPLSRPAGTLLRVTPGDIHSMVAHKGGMSLHIYTPSIHDMKVFDTEKRRTLVVTDDCGAWVPHPSQIVSEEAWLPTT